MGARRRRRVASGRVARQSSPGSTALRPTPAPRPAPDPRRSARRAERRVPTPGRHDPLAPILRRPARGSSTTPNPPACNSHSTTAGNAPPDSRDDERRSRPARLRRRRLARRLRRPGWKIPTRARTHQTPAIACSGTRATACFEDVTEQSRIARLPRGYGHGVTVGDVDNDGRPDLFLTRWQSYALFRNQGDGTFEDITSKAGLGGDRDWPTSAAFADLDGDGDLDLYVCHYLDWDCEHPRACWDKVRSVFAFCGPPEFSPMPDHLFRNDGGRFVDVSAEAGIVDRTGQGLGVVANDLDGDGRVDLFVANDQSAKFLFLNRGGLRFEEVGHVAGVASNASGMYQASMGVACADVDGDGLPELAVTNFYNEYTALYQNLGAGIFSDHSVEYGLAVASRYRLGFGIAFLDFNNDGRLDLVTANGHVDDNRADVPQRMRAQLFAGAEPGLKLVDVTDHAGTAFQLPLLGRGLAAGDLDNDGRIDVLIVSQNQPLAYFHNQTDGGRFLSLRLEGRHPSSRDAIGARVTIEAGGRRQVGYRFGGGSYQSASDPRLHFGLGTAASVDRVEVAWPSGRCDRYENLTAGTGYLLREGDAQAHPLPGFQPVPVPAGR